MTEFTFTRGNEVYKITAADEAAAERVIKEEFSSDKYAPETTPGDVGRGVASGGTAGAINIVPGTGALVADIATAPGVALYKGIDLAAGLAGYDTGLAESYKPGGFFGHSAESARLSQELADKIIAPPVSTGGKIARAATSAGVEALGGSGLFRVAATGQIFSNADDAARAAETVIRQGTSPRAALAVKEMGADVPAQAAYSVAAAGGGEIAEQQGLPPIVGTVAGLAAAAGAHTAGKAGTTAAKNTLADIDENLQRTEPAQQRAAAERLRTTATDRPALEEWTRRGETGELVPGSKPTLFEATGDTGIGGQENRAFQRGTELDRETGATFKTAMEERRAEQNAARLAEIESVGGEGRKAAVLEEFKRQRDELDRVTGQEEAAAQSGADVAAQRAGTTAQPEAVGEAIRTPVVAAERAAKAEGGRLYDAIAAEGVTVGTGRLKAAVGREFRDIPESPLSGDERHFADLIKGYGGRLDFDLLQKLRSEVAARSRQFTLPDTERRRFTLLKNAIDQAMDDGLAKAMDSDPSLMQRAAANVPIDDTLTQAQRAANTHWREMKQTFGAEPVKPITAKAPTASGFKMTEAKIPETAFRPGPTGAEHIRALRAAGATDAALTDAAALSFQQKVIRDGAVNPNDFRRWAHNHAAAISELPAAVQRRFLSAADATAALRDATANRLAELRKFDQSAVGKVLGIPEQDLEKAIKTYLETPSQAEKLAAAVAGNAEAQAGLRRLAADYIVRQFTGASDDISKASLTTWLKRNRGGMEAIFGKEGATRFQRLSDDIERSRKQMTTGKDPAGSSTAGNLASMMKPAAGATVMTLLAHAAGPKGLMVAGTLKSIAANMKLAGMADVDALFARALLDPELARKLLTKAPALKNEKFLKGLGSTILRSSLAGMAYGGNQ